MAAVGQVFADMSVAVASHIVDNGKIGSCQEIGDSLVGADREGTANNWEVEHQIIAEATLVVAPQPHVTNPDTLDIAGHHLITKTHKSPDDHTMASHSSKHKLEDADDYSPKISSAAKRRQSGSRPYTRSQAASVVPAVPSAYVSSITPSSFSVGLHDNKPTPSGPPPVWSEKRAALNDALPYFKAHQGGMYSTKKVAKGILIDSEVGVRDSFSSQVIITSIGGGRVRDNETKKMVRVEDHNSASRYLQCFENAKAGNLCFPIVAGAGNRLWPVKPPHYYTVLDYFHVTDIWCELADGGQKKSVKTYMIRLEKVDLASKSWWTPNGCDGHDADEYEIGEYSCSSRICQDCQVSSKEMFTQGWACMNKDCARFFEFDHSIDIDKLTYADAFLRERTAYTGTQENGPLVPELPISDDSESGSEERFKQGIVCPQCRCCSRRIHWSYWDCENKECDFRYRVDLNIITPEQIKLEDENLRRQKRPEKLDFADPIIRVAEFRLEKAMITIYLMPDENGENIGIVSRIRPDQDVIERQGGLNDIFLALQELDMGLKRRPAKNPGARVEEMTSHFSANFGAPYKFGVVVDGTIAFIDAPSTILEIVSRITWAGKTAVEVGTDLIEKENIPVVEGAIPKEFEPYNELLALGYFEKSKISPHDDGEKELGPNVASLSLGSPSVMKFAPKKGVNIGSAKDIENKNRKPVLSLLLEHGDMLVMHGEIIQKLYLHEVNPYGGRRFALTCRKIKEETIPDAKQRELATVNGKMPDDWNGIRYNGQIDQLQSRTTGEVVERPGTPKLSRRSGEPDSTARNYNESVPDEGISNDNAVPDSADQGQTAEDGLSNEEDGLGATSPQPSTERFLAFMQRTQNEINSDPTLISQLQPNEMREAHEFGMNLCKMTFAAQGP
ncbi:uncharacterized protein F4822DRAFT_441355 [Hypoxylon trugodes]|uniref:uncharacterized protein n=1 Tax=Hypoxylon trugodes TaxID=326681 RepID=UPI0021990DE4|nr:uncharacterized protein F4822DRAFT_441355 [Hypoxylon trugodes]KAI1392335.1 hypothetical protein F4822DRAFT_441355 [Hypoxylon trugodes]